MEQQTLTFILNVAYIWGDGLAISALGDEKGSEMVLKTVQRVACHIGQRESAPAAVSNKIWRDWKAKT
jgi:hypothetical protein